jgi:hypothetical protein
MCNLNVRFTCFASLETERNSMETTRTGKPRFVDVLRREITRRPCLTFNDLATLVACHDVGTLENVAHEDNYGPMLGERSPRLEDISGFVGLLQEQTELVDASANLLTVAVRLIAQIKGLPDGRWRHSVAVATEQLINLIDGNTNPSDIGIALRICREELNRIK